MLDALEFVVKYHDTKKAQQFGVKYLKSIVDAILDQQVATGEKKNQIIVAILRTSVDIIGKELISNGDVKECTALDAIASIFDKKKAYYGDSESSGNPGFRVDMIKRFGDSSRRGFHHLATRVAAQSSEFPRMETLHLILLASIEAAFVMSLDEAPRRISRATMDHLLGSDDLTIHTTQIMHLVRRDLQRLCKKLSLSTPQVMSDFNQFWRSLTLKLLKSESQEHKLFGLKEIENLMAACRIPEAYIVKGAGDEIVNGRYEISPSLITNDGCVRSQTVTYERTSDCGEKFTIHPCLMTEPGKSHCDVWYFLSKSKGFDYYFHDTSPDEQDRPPLLGWKWVAGRNPAPILEQSSNTIPCKDEKGNLEKQLNKWAVESDVYGIILGRCIDENHLQASASLRNFLSKMNTPNLTCAQVVLSNSLALGQGASLLESFLPLLRTGPTVTSQAHPTQSLPSSASSYTTAIAAAKQRLISAQRWKQSMESSLQGYIDASRELQAARSSLLDLERNHGIIDVDADDEDEEPQAKRSKRKAS